VTLTFVLSTQKWRYQSHARGRILPPNLECLLASIPELE